MPFSFHRRAFTLIELLTVIGIVSILIAILLPAVSKARNQAITLRCAANLQQLGIAMQNYLIDNRQWTFWRGENPSLEGMDWYAYGGRESGNLHTGQAGLFNRFQPRPLNPYVGGKIDLFRCPSDTEPAEWTRSGVVHFDWVGNSYAFNAIGEPGILPYSPDRGLAGVRYGRIRQPSTRLLFVETADIHGWSWHSRGRGNVCLADGHVETVVLASAIRTGELRW